MVGITGNNGMTGNGDYTPQKGTMVLGIHRCTTIEYNKNRFGDVISVYQLRTPSNITLIKSFFI